MGEILYIEPGYRDLLSRHGLCGLSAFFDWQRGDRLDKPNLAPWRQRWRLILQDGDGSEKVFYLKRFCRPPVSSQLERWRIGRWRTSTAGIEATNARLLAEAGIAAARVAACGERMAGPFERCSFVLLRETPGESLERWVPAHVPPANGERDPNRRRRRIDRLGRFVGDFHRAGFVHRDLYLSHIFIHGAPEEQDEFSLIDLQRVFRPRIRARRWAVKDLAALHVSTPTDRVSAAERMRFLCRYVRVCPRFGSARTLARMIERKTARMAARVPARPFPISIGTMEIKNICRGGAEIAEKE